MTDTTCHYHRGELATDLCTRCNKPLCADCVRFENHQLVCPECAHGSERSRNARIFVAAVLVVAAAVGVVLFLRSRPAPKPKMRPAPPFDYGIYTAAVEKQRRLLEREPCNRQVILEHAETLAKAGDFRGVIDRGNQFFAACGDHSLLRWKTYYAHEQLSEWDGAIADATRLIEETPDDHDFWWWRGEAYEHAGKLEQAAEDYQQALLITPELEDTPFRLAAVLDKLGRPCAALEPLEQYAYFHPDAHEDSSFTHQLSRLREQGSCRPATSGEGRAVVRFPRHGDVIRTTATIGGIDTEVVIDTGATYVSISGELADKLGLALSDRSYSVATASGVTRGRLAVVPAIRLQSLEAETVPVVVVEGADGPALLGLSFLRRYRVELDPDHGKLTVEERPADDDAAE